MSREAAGDSRARGSWRPATLLQGFPLNNCRSAPEAAPVVVEMALAGADRDAHAAGRVVAVAERLGEVDRANDVVQETFLRLYHYRQAYTRDAKFATWLYKVASNITKTELRREYVSRRYLVHGISTDSDGEWSSDEFLDRDSTPDLQVDTTLKMRLVQQALMQISAAYREVVILRDIQQMSYEEITEITGLGLGTVKSRINRGRAQLQKLLRGIYQEDGDVAHS